MARAPTDATAIHDAPTEDQTRSGEAWPANGDRVTHTADTEAPPARRPRLVRDSDAPPFASLGTGALTAVSIPTTPPAALRQAEIARTRLFVPLTLTLAVIALSCLPVLGGDVLARRVLQGGIAISALGVMLLYWLAQRPERFTDVRVGATYAICMAGVYGAVYYFGVYSPANALIVYGLYFIGLSGNTRVSLVLYILAAALQGAMALLVIGEVIIDRGLITGAELTLRQEFIVLFLMQVVFFVTYLVAYVTKRQAERSMAELDQAARAIAQREALLQEARLELDQARKVGGPGRFTDQVLGSFRLGVVLGRGSMGEVYDAVHTETGRPAAVKLLHAAALSRSSPLTRFVREAQAAGTLESPHVVRVLEVSDAEAPVPYLAMEKLEGTDLSSMLRAQRRLPLKQVLTLVRHVASGLEAARAANVVHRDLKPQNLFRDRQPGQKSAWKILDFGVSKLADHDGSLTAGRVVGTPVYMSPEQAQSREVDHRSDVYSLTAVAFRALTGTPPFAGKDVPAILYNVVYTMPQSPDRVVKLPTDVVRVLAIGLAKKPSARFPTAAELATALEAASKSKLAPALRDRADALLAAKPWGR